MPTKEPVNRDLPPLKINSKKLLQSGPDIESNVRAYCRRHEINFQSFQSELQARLSLLEILANTRILTAVLTNIGFLLCAEKIPKVLSLETDWSYGFVVAGIITTILNWLADDIERQNRKAIESASKNAFMENCLLSNQEITYLQVFVEKLLTRCLPAVVQTLYPPRTDHKTVYKVQLTNTSLTDNQPGQRTSLLSWYQNNRILHLHRADGQIYLDGNSVGNKVFQVDLNVDYLIFQRWLSGNFTPNNNASTKIFSSPQGTSQDCYVNTPIGWVRVEIKTNHSGTKCHLFVTTAP